MDQLLKSFGIDGKLLFWQALNFGVLFGILWYLFYKPVRHLMAEREKKIQESLVKADELNKKSGALENEFRKKMAAQRKEIEEFHEKALREAERLKKELKLSAAEEAAKIIKDSRGLAEEERAHLLKSVETEIKNLAVALASKILEKEIDEETQKKLIEEALESLKKNL